ncbi:TPA: AAC(6')-Ia family aminoglycoside 6'-N-acetyltransferase [Citrobacter amalonaticus]|nr:AAC(6')-Ia family aminoglycoside 6'-N-acetyltransferase [Citrobacter amalonaticus]HAT3758326.1 AAC(6')-Ia family aminoglycoside 6'-N-acetyltransferase [Citrobacter amalonaticus]
MIYNIINIADSEKNKEDAARILYSAFRGKGKDAWPTLDSAREEIAECIASPNICLGITLNDRLVGWGGLRPMYETTWELHPLVIDPDYQGNGLGRLLLSKIESTATTNRIIGIMLGTDDETLSTSLSMTDIDESNIFQEIKNIINIKNHPFEFYKKCGYIIVGIVPNANGYRKPDIWMWKNLERKSG